MVVVNFFADFLAGSQSHQHQLKVLACVEHPAEILVLDRQPVNVIDKTLITLSSIALW